MLEMHIWQVLSIYLSLLTVTKENKLVYMVSDELRMLS